MSLSYWDGAYRTGRKIWGGQPSDIARAVGGFFEQEKIPTAGKRMLEIGCGYGRDALYLADRWKVRAVATDPSAQAIEMAQASLTRRTGKRSNFTGPASRNWRPNLSIWYMPPIFTKYYPRRRETNFVSRPPAWLAPAGAVALGHAFQPAIRSTPGKGKREFGRAAVSAEAEISSSPKHARGTRERTLGFWTFAHCLSTNSSNRGRRAGRITISSGS